MLYAFIRRLHLTIYAYFVKWFRTKAMVKAFATAHAQELRLTPVSALPMTLARQSAEIQAIKAGKLDASIVDRKSWAWPFLPASVNRLSIPIIKSTPYNLRRMSRTPVPRRAINLIKGALISQPWDVRPIEGEVAVNDDTDQEERIKIAKKLFSHPNNVDSFQTWLEQGTEDMCVLGGFVSELAVTPDPERPIKMWCMNIESIRIFAAWTESVPDMPHYCQMTGLKGERGALLFYEDEVLYVKDNPSTDNPFGLGKMEVAFQSVNDFLGVQGMAGRAGTDQVHKCFPEWTEVLTRRGWITWREATDDDEFATRSMDGKLQWQKPLGFVRAWHDGDLIQFRNRNLKITVTPNHRMLGECTYAVDGKRVSEQLGFIEAESVFKAATLSIQGNGKPGGKRVKSRGRKLVDFKIPAFSTWEDGVLPSDEFVLGKWRFKWEDWAAFLGIWIAEGSCLSKALLRSDFRIQIGQSKQANKVAYDRIETLLKRMGFKYSAKNDRFLFNDRVIWSHLSSFGSSHFKFVPQWLKDAPVHIIKIFVEWALLGDGTKRTGVYLTASKRLADDMQELFQKIGLSAAIGLYVQRDCELNGQVIRGGGRLLYKVEPRRRAKVRLVPRGSRGKQRIPIKIPYSGMVYCAMVPNGTLYCREDGQPFWSGNTFLWWEAPQNEAHIQIVRRHVQNELEGQAKLSLITGMKKPEPIEVTPVLEADLLLNWQELLIRMIANGFDMSAMALGVEHDINRAVGEVLDDKDFRSAVVPMARRLQESFTRKILHRALGWTDLEFVYLSLDDPDAETKMDMLTRMFSTNSVSPNEIRVKMGYRKSSNPMYDLNQFEMMLLNAEVAANLQDRNQARGMQRQTSMMQQQQQNQQPEQEQQEPGGAEGENFDQSKPQEGKGGFGQGQPGQSGGGGKPQTPPAIAAPKSLSLPKFPVSSIAGGRYTARQIATMPVNQLTDVYKASGLSGVEFLRALDDSEPGVLEQLLDEVKEFFDDVLQKENQKSVPISKKTLNRWKKDLAVKVRKQNSRTADMTTWLMKLGRNTGKPGQTGRDVPVFAPKDRRAGKPGVPPRYSGI